MAHECPQVSKPEQKTEREPEGASSNAVTTVYISSVVPEPPHPTDEDELPLVYVLTASLEDGSPADVGALKQVHVHVQIRIGDVAIEP